MSSAFDVHWSPQQPQQKALEVGSSPKLQVNLGSFRVQDMLQFGSVEMGSTIAGDVELVNPFDKDIVVVLERFNGTRQGFGISDDSWSLEARETISFCVTWTPCKTGGVRTSLHLSFVNEDSHRVRIAAFMSGVVVSNENKNKKIENRKSVVVETKAPLRAIENRNPPSKTLKLRHGAEGEDRRRQKVVDTDMRRVLYDENWMEKQEGGFANWLNYVMNPSTEDTLEDIDRHAFKILAEKQQRATIARQTYSIFQSKELQSVAFLVDKEIACSGVSIREDKDVFKDLGLRKLVIDLLLSYNQVWLKIGLETVLGKELPGGRGLRKVIVNNFLSDTELNETFKETKRGLFDENPEYKSQMRRLTLRRFLMLVIFLDRAKIASVIDHPSCLFEITSGVKSSNDVLIAFAKEFLSGEGNIIRHLQHSCGYQVFHVQTVLDEFDFKVEHLATDLRDGLRLTRAVELLTGNKERTLSNKLRAPAVSRLQKLHNVGLALNELERNGISLQTSVKFSALNKSNLVDVISNKDIVDGHRQKTLALLWKMIAKWKVSLIVPLADLKDEIHQIKSRHGQTASSIFQTSQRLVQVDEETDLDDHSSMVSSLLLEWCQAIGAHHGVRVVNMTTSMANGLVLCLLVHHYHPKLLPREAISKTVVQLVQSDVDWMPFDASRMSRMEFKRAMVSEQANFKLVNECSNALGCVPVLLPAFDSENIPEAKMMLLFVSYLCTRLLASRNEINAASKIQNLWILKRGSIRTRHLLDATCIAKICFCQQFIREYIARRRSRRMISGVTKFQAAHRGWMDRSIFLACREMVICCQSVVRMRLAVRERHARREMVAQDKATRQIQSCFRMMAARSNYTEQMYSVILLQTVVRRKLVFLRISKMGQAVQVIQSCFRGYTAVRYFKGTRTAAVTIQSQVRKFLQRISFTTTVQAIILIQSVIRQDAVRVQFEFIKRSVLHLQMFWRSILYKRMIRCRQQLQRENIGSVSIQSAYRMHAARNSFVHVKQSCILIQRCFCMHKTRQEFRNKRNAAVLMQSLFRGFQAKICFMDAVLSAISIQGVYRRYVQVKKRDQEIREDIGSVSIQSMYRMHATRNSFLHSKKSCIKIQRCFMMHRTRQEFISKRNAVVLMQSSFRGFQAKICFMDAVISVISIQAVFRGFVKVNALKRIRNAVTLMQSVVRRDLVQMRYYYVREQVIMVQSFARGLLVRKVRRGVSVAAKSIQTQWRIYSAKQRLYQALDAALTLQKTWRMVIQNKHYHSFKQDVVSIQCFWRGAAARKSFASQLNASIQIQSWWRMCIMQEKYLVTIAAAVRVQSFGRCLLAHKNFSVTLKSVVYVQSWIRKEFLREQFVYLKYNVQIMQGAVRAYLWRRQQTHCIKIQSTIRRILAEVRYRDVLNNVTSVQSCIRCFLCSRRFQKTQTRVLKIQTFIRLNQQRSRYERFLKALVTIQNRKRMHDAQCSYNDSMCGSLVVQSFCRMVQSRKRFNQSKESVIVLQAFFRKISVQDMFQMLRTECITIQCWWRRTRSLLRLKAAVNVQRIVRGSLKRHQYVACQRDVVVIQSVIRRRSCARKYRSCIGAVITLQSFMRKKCLNAFSVSAAAVLIQTLLRGILVRKHSSAAVLICRKKLEAAHRNAKEEHKLGNRTKSALDWLLKSKNLAHVLEACTTLKMSTSLSAGCCESVLCSNATQVLFKLIKSCNRSEPHQRVLEVVLVVLAQVAMYDEGTNFSRMFLVPEECVLTIVDLLQIFRDKQGIFSHALSLFEIFCSSAMRKQKYILTDSELCKRILSIEDILKKKMQLMNGYKAQPAKSRMYQRMVAEKEQYMRLKSIATFLKK